MKRIVCFILSAALVFTSATGTYAATNTKATTAKTTATATVMAAPTEAQVKAVVTKYFNAYFSGNTVELEKVYTMTSKDRSIYETYVALIEGIFKDGYKIFADINTAKLSSTIKKGSTYTFTISGQSALLAKSVYGFESFNGSITVTWVGKTLKLTNFVESSSVEITDPKKSILYTKALSEAGIFGEAYVEALKMGIQPAKDYSDAKYIDLMEKGQPIELTLNNASIEDELNIHLTPKEGEKTSISFDLGTYQKLYDGVTIDFEIGEKGLPYKVKAYADGVFIEEFTITEDESIDYAIYDEKVVTFEFEANEAFNIPYLELYKED